MPSIAHTLAGQTQSLLGCFEYSPGSRPIDTSVTTQPAATAHLCTVRGRAVGKGRIGKPNISGWKSDLLLHSHMGEGSHENVRRTAVRMASAATSSPQVGQEATSTVPQEFVELAHKLADAAGEITTKFFRTGVNVESKADASPVTQADRAAEAAMRALIHQSFPDHGVFGEEAGLELGARGREYVWVLDPIDGTKSFITGKPLFGTLIALVHNAVPILGIIDQPVLKERWLGVAGSQSTLNGKAISARSCRSISDAYMYSTTPHMFEGQTEEAWLRVRDKVRLPLYGCDCYAYGLLAAGLCDLVVEADLKPYDYLALVPIIEGAGGVITDWEGESLRWDAARYGQEPGEDPPAYEVLAAGDGGVHLQVLESLDWRNRRH